MEELFYFTIQNVPIKSDRITKKRIENIVFTIQNVPIKLGLPNCKVNDLLLYNTKCSY